MIKPSFVVVSVIVVGCVVVPVMGIPLDHVQFRQSVDVVAFFI
jgi:hypothetical protein